MFDKQLTAQTSVVGDNTLEIDLGSIEVNQQTNERITNFVNTANDLFSDVVDFHQGSFVFICGSIDVLAEP